jgi:pimeloyl-ACP methyl ester carboxylesterase
LLLRGSEPNPLARRDLKRLAGCIPGARVAELPNADHLLTLDNPHDYAALVDEWVEEEVTL